MVGTFSSIKINSHNYDKEKVHGSPMELFRLIGGDGEVRSLHLAILEAMHVKGVSYVL